MSFLKQSINFNIFLTALPWFGLEMFFQLGFHYASSTALNPPFPQSTTWLWVPISGIFVGPIIGAWSDSLENTASNLNFICFGLCSSIIFLFLFSCSIFYSLSTTLAYVSLVCFVISLNVVQTPLRTLVADRSPAHLQISAQFMAAMFQGLGSFISSILNGWKLDEGMIQYRILILSSIVAGVNIVVFGCSVCLLRNEPLVIDTPANISLPLTSADEELTLFSSSLAVEASNLDTGSLSSVLVRKNGILSQVIFEIFDLERKISVVGGVQLVCWAALYAFLPNMRYIWSLSSNTSIQLYNVAIEYRNLSLSFFACILGFLMVHKVALKVKLVYFLSLLYFSSILFAWHQQLLKQLDVDALAVFFVLSLGFSLACIHSIPYALVGMVVKSRKTAESNSDMGLQMGILNFFIAGLCLSLSNPTVPQLFMTLIISNVKPEVGLLIAASLFLLASLLVLTIPLPTSPELTSQPSHLVF